MRRAVSEGVYVDQEWSNRRSGQVVTIRNVYRKDGSVLVVCGDKSRTVMAIRDLKQFYYPLTIYISPKE